MKGIIPVDSVKIKRIIIDDVKDTDKDKERLREFNKCEKALEFTDARLACSVGFPRKRKNVIIFNSLDDALMQCGGCDEYIERRLGGYEGKISRLSKTIREMQSKRADESADTDRKIERLGKEIESGKRALKKVTEEYESFNDGSLEQKYIDAMDLGISNAKTKVVDERKEANKTLAIEREVWDKGFSDLKGKHLDAIETLKDQYSKDKRTLKKVYSDEASRLEKKYNTEIAQSNKKHSKKVKDIQDKMNVLEEKLITTQNNLDLETRANVGVGTEWMHCDIEGKIKVRPDECKILRVSEKCKHELGCAPFRRHHMLPV